MATGEKTLTRDDALMGAIAGCAAYTLCVVPAVANGPVVAAVVTTLAGGLAAALVLRLGGYRRFAVSFAVGVVAGFVLATSFVGAIVFALG